MGEGVGLIDALWEMNGEHKRPLLRAARRGCLVIRDFTLKV